jgi:hypothetical protein
MSKQAVSNVSYPVIPGTTALLSIDCQVRARNIDTVVVGGLTGGMMG